MKEAVWLFGYGSLIYKVDFPYLESCRVHVDHWVRRFWQGSHDHRGTPDNPGRVLTLYPLSGARCEGVAYKVAPETLRAIDIREKNGYVRRTLPLVLPDGQVLQGIAYVADRSHSAFLGAASLASIARQIVACQGESGSNRDYLVELASSLRTLAIEDGHVQSLMRRLQTVDSSQSANYY